EAAIPGMFPGTDRLPPAAPSCPARLHLVEVAGFAPSPFEAEFGRHIAVAVPLADFDGLQRRLVAHGATLIDPQRPTPFQRFFFRDPDGHVFEVVAAEGGPEATVPTD